MEEARATIRIWFEKLAVIKDGDNTRLPLSSLDSNSHIHGGLRIQIDDRYVPLLGYFGPDDVCFSTWIEELDNVVKAFDDKETASYTFDEGEQGQPAFFFEKKGGTMSLSIIDAGFSGGEADPDWQRIPFAYRDFLIQYRGFRVKFIAEVRRAEPVNSDIWLATFLESPA